MKRKVFFLILCFILSFNLIAYAAITPEQGNDVATFARNFVEKGNARRDEKGYPLLTYALSGNWNTCIEIRNKGYNEQLYYVKNNSYYYRLLYTALDRLLRGALLSQRDGNAFRRIVCETKDVK